ncbi:MAG TPA: hypothetical protein VFQ94_01535 [Gallionella sp.]|nr:hypothetical protein [Gallionella sp.]
MIYARLNNPQITENIGIIGFSLCTLPVHGIIASSSGLPALSVQLDVTTDMTASHLTNPAQGAGQVIGYSHSARLPKGFA